MKHGFGQACEMISTSTSEVYGDPEVHPQVEEWGNVNPIGIALLRRRQADR